MQLQARESIHQQVIDSISREDAPALDQFLAESLMDNNPIPGQSSGRTGFEEWMASAPSSFPELQRTIEDVIVANSDYVVGRVAWHGTQHGPFAGLPPTHQAVELYVIHIVRFEAEVIVKWWGIADIFGAVQQVGGKVVLE